jgi:hypothetical protein
MVNKIKVSAYEASKILIRPVSEIYQMVLAGKLQSVKSDGSVFVVLDMDDLQTLTEYITFKDAAARLGVTRSYLWQMSKRGQLKTTIINGVHYIDLRSLHNAETTQEDVASTYAGNARYGLVPS